MVLKKIVKLTFLLLLVFSCTEKESTKTVTVQPSVYDGPHEPVYLLQDQWHLKNTGQVYGTVGEDINVESVWGDGNFGSGVTVAIVDDGLQIAHPDLQPNVFSGYSYNYLTGSTNPSPTGNDGHGTSIGGIIAADASDESGVKGIAPSAKLVGFNMLQYSTDAVILDSLQRHSDNGVVSVSNNSWGNSDNGHFHQPIASVVNGVNHGLSNGRSGKGIVYVWAAGNGGGILDRAGYDSLTNHRGVMPVCAVDNEGRYISYSERGANLWVCGPSGRSSSRGIVTTDLIGFNQGYNVQGSSGNYTTNYDYTNNFNGTSAAAPMVSGVVALVLAENPALTWRDVKMILATTADKNSSADTYWDTNAAGLDINEKFGFGVVDAAAAVAAAQGWTNLAPEASPESHPGAGFQTVNQTLPENTLVSDTITVAGSGITKIEFVEITLNMNHYDWGSYDIKLTSPGGTESILATLHSCQNNSGGVDCPNSNNSFTFGISRYLNESPNGDWTLSIEDEYNDGQQGTWNSWRLKIYGH